MPLLWISIAFIAGLVLEQYLPWSGAGWLICAGVGLLIWGVCHSIPQRLKLLAPLYWLARREAHLFLPPILLIVFLALGAARMAFSGPDLAGGHIAALNDQGTFRITAVVDMPLDLRDTTSRIHLAVEQAAPLDEAGNAGPARPIHGALLVLVPGRAEWQYGDRLVLDGNPITPPADEGFSYRVYLARQNIYTYLTYPRIQRIAQNAGSPIMAAIYRLRNWAYAEVFHLYPSPEAPLLAGILLGIDSDLPPGLAQAFQDTGTAHVIAISGFNIAILAELFSKLFGRIFSRWWATLLSILVIAGYTVMVGATPSVVRAAIMGSLSLIGVQIGRRSAGANTLALTAALMSLSNPQLPWDASFQLSFGATLGLILYGDRLQNGFKRLLERRFSADLARKIAGPVGEYVLLTLAAQLLTLPVILYHFQRLSLISLLANPLILPPQPLVMVFSGVAVLAGAVFDPLAHLLAWLAWPFAAYTNRMVEALAAVPGGVMAFDRFDLGSVAFMYTLVLIPVISPRFPRAIQRSVTPAVVLTTLGLVATLAWRGAATAPDGRLRLVMSNLNGSPVVLLIGPDGETLLINGSSSARLLNDALDRWLSPFDRSLDGLLINASQTGQLNGLSTMLESHPVKQIWWGSQPPTGRSGQRLIAALQSTQAEAYQLEAGEALALGDEARLETLVPDSNGSALLLTWRNFRALIPAGLAPDHLPPGALTNLTLILLEPRDLEKTTPEEWLALAPQAILAAPGESPFLPSGRNWLNTQPGSGYIVVTDGKQMWLEQK